MSSKFKKYGNYILSFGKSADKRALIKELLKEIIKKGVVGGFQSLLHKKVYNRELRNIKIETDVAFPGTGHLTIKEYNKGVKIVLPLVITPKVSIVIAAPAKAAHLYNCISSIYENNKFHDYEIIIVGHQLSTDTDLLRSHFENIIIIKGEANISFLKNCNHAATYARGEYIVFLDNHTRVQEGWLEELLFVFEHNKFTGLAGSKLLYPDGHLQEAGGIVWQDGTIMSYGKGNNPDLSEYNYVKEVDFVSGTSIMIKKKLWDEIGGFNEQYLPHSCADTNLCFEIRNKGYKVIYQPFSSVVNFAETYNSEDVNDGIKNINDTDRKKFYDKWSRVLDTKSDNIEHIFFERDRTVGEKHVLVVDPYLPDIDKETSEHNICNFIEVLVDLNYSVKLLSENEQNTPKNKTYFQHKEVEVLYGNGSYFEKQGWRHYLNTNLGTIDAVILSRSPLCMQVVSFLRSNHYRGDILYYEYGCNYLIVENEPEQAKGAPVVINTRKHVLQAAEGEELINSREQENFSKRKMAEAFLSIIQ